MKRNLSTVLEKAAKDIINKLTPEDIHTFRRILGRFDNITAHLETVVQELEPTLTDMRQLTQNADPVIKRTDKLLMELEAIADGLHNLPEEKKDEIKQAMGKLNETADQINNVTANLQEFTAFVEEKYPEISDGKIGQIIREFLQEEGVKVNVGELGLWKGPGGKR